MLSENEPCVRNTMPDCSNLEKDTCYVAKPWCCPNKYYCQRSPVVGLYCQRQGSAGSSTCWGNTKASPRSTCPFRGYCSLALCCARTARSRSTCRS